MNKLPSFICVGAQKAGTTSLHDILSQDSQLYLPEIKETKFFQLDSRYNQGIKYYKEEYFNDVQDKQLVGEIDPDYMYFNYVPKRIYETLGKDVKLIFVLRNPIKRAISHYQMSKRRGFEDLSFEEAVKVENERLKIDDSQEEFYKSKTHNASYIDRGYYSKQIEEYLKYFPKENMMFILFEDDFLKNKQKTIEDIYKFLNIQMPKNLDLDVKSNGRSTYRFKFVTNLVHKPNIIRTTLKYFFPRKSRDSILKILDKVNQKDISKTSIPSKKASSYMMNQYYKEEIVVLEKILSRNLDSWYE